MRKEPEPDIFEDKKQLILVLVGLVLGAIILSVGAHWIGVLWYYVVGIS